MLSSQNKFQHKPLNAVPFLKGEKRKKKKKNKDEKISRRSRSRLTCDELERRVSASVGVCRTQRKSAPAGGETEQERESAARRGAALRPVSGFMELCASDPPPWIAIRDRSSSFYTFSRPASPLPPPSSTPPTKVRQLSGCRRPCLCVCVCVYRGRARINVCERCAPAQDRSATLDLQFK